MASILSEAKDNNEPGEVKRLNDVLSWETCLWQVFCAYMHLLKMRQDVHENIQWN